MWEDAYDFSGLRILLAEDNELNQQIARELLEGVGAIVVTVDNGREALEALLSADEPFDLVLMDIQMPEMDGLEATRRIRMIERFADLPIIALIAHAFAEERQRSITAGMNDHVIKPIDYRDLMEVVVRQVPGKRGLRKAENDPSPAIVATGLDALAQLDTENALRRMGGNRKLYLDIPEKFRHGQRDAFDRIVSSLDNGKRAVAERVAHTVKGLAGTIGVLELQTVAAELERSIRGPSPPEQADLQLRSFSDQLSRLLSALDQAATEPGAETSQAEDAIEVDPRETVSVIRRLAHYIRESDSASSDYLAQFRALLLATFSSEELAQLAKNIGDYDFDESLETLQAMMDRAGIDEETNQTGEML